MKKRGKHHRFKDKKKSRDFTLYLKKFVFWFIVYFISIIIITLLFEKTKIYQAKIGFYLIMGFILVIISRIVYFATKKKHFRFSGIILWGVIYAVVFGLVSFILGRFPQIQINASYDKYLNMLIFSAIFTIILMFLRRMKIGSLRIGKTRFKAPSQIFTGIILIVTGILTFRFSVQIFIGWFNWAEGMAWSWLIGLALIIAGFLVLLAWWRDNVLQHRIGLKIEK